MLHLWKTIFCSLEFFFVLNFKSKRLYQHLFLRVCFATILLKNMNGSLLSVHPGQIGECGNAWKNFFKKSFIYLNYGAEVRRSGIEGAEHQIPKMERRCGVRNSPPDGAEVRCAEHQIRVRCPALQLSTCIPFFLLFTIPIFLVKTGHLRTWRPFFALLISVIK